MWLGLVTAVVTMLMYETTGPVLSMVFNNSKLSIEAIMPNNVNDVKLHVTPLQYIDVIIDNVKCKGLCDSGAQIPMKNKRLVGGIAESLGTVQGASGPCRFRALLESPWKPNLCH